MRITILGAGAYGLALALSFYKNNNQVTIWTKVESEKEDLLTYRENRKSFPNVKIPEAIKITTDLSYIRDCDLIVLAIPLPFLRDVCLELKNYVSNNMHFCIASKGIENRTNQLAHEIFTSIISTKHYGVLSGPTFAVDLAMLSPGGLTLATLDTLTYEIVKNSLESGTLKITYTNDIIGTEICGSIKNVMAILSGILEGMHATETTKALFLTNAMYELENLITSLHGKKETTYSYAGIGDLLLTCTSKKSRNFTLGILIATESQEKIKEFIENNTVEGYYTLLSIYQIIQSNHINSPLIQILYEILFKTKDKKELFTILTK